MLLLVRTYQLCPPYQKSSIKHLMSGTYPSYTSSSDLIDHVPLSQNSSIILVRNNLSCSSLSELIYHAFLIRNYLSWSDQNLSSMRLLLRAYLSCTSWSELINYAPLGQNLSIMHLLVRTYLLCTS